MNRLPTRHCDECEYSNWTEEVLLHLAHNCAKGHKPRYYMPRCYGDDNCGFKRRCEDYKISDATMRRIEANMWTSLQDAKKGGEG